MAEELTGEQGNHIASLGKNSSPFAGLRNALVSVIVFNLIYVVGFFLFFVTLISWIPRYAEIASSSVYLWDYYFKFGPPTFLAGLIVALVAYIGLAISGIIVLVVKRPANFENGLVIATGVVAVLGAGLIVASVLSVILLLKIRYYNRYSAGKNI